MKINEIRIYAEVLEQGLDFKSYIKEILPNTPIKNIYTKKLRGEFCKNDSVIDKIRKVKDIDILITSISGNCEYPLLLVEYSTAVPTDDHRMQRSDVYYWSSVFKIPVMKISPIAKGMIQAFGGGSKFTDELEIAAALRRNSVLYHIPWETEDQKETLRVKENALSCIAHSLKIRNILENILNYFSVAPSFKKFFDSLYRDFENQNKEVLRMYTDNKIRQKITSSSRFTWFDNKLRVKINRFGHAMDPDRGVLYFTGMILGADKMISEIQVNRPSNYFCRGGYEKLFDGISRKNTLKEYVNNIINNGNEFTDEDAIYVFKTALNIDNTLTFKKISPHNYVVDDNELFAFLTSHPSTSAKSIFFLSTALHLTDKNRNTICKIKWNIEPITAFINSLSVSNHNITPLLPLSTKEAKEDIITYASVELYKKLKYNLLAVSYPGAQGDRCILTGSGRTVGRTYIDIIAFKKSSTGVNVFLQESKEYFSNSKSDVIKLNDFKTNTDKINSLKQLFRKTVKLNDYSKLYTSVAGKNSHDIPDFDVDYIFMFDIDSTDTHKTIIRYSVAIIDMSLAHEFSNLKNNDGKLRGTIEIDKIYRVK